MGDSKQRSSVHAGRTVDAHGRRVKQLDPVAMHMLKKHDVIERDALEAIAHEIGFGIARWRMNVGYVCWTLGALYCLAVVILKFVLGFKIVSLVGLAWLINGAVIIVGMTFTWYGAQRIRSSRVQAVLLKHFRCPHCGYDLHGLPADTVDGGTLCPECGCTWRLTELEDDDHEKSAEQARSRVIG